MVFLYLKFLLKAFIILNIFDFNENEEIEKFYIKYDNLMFNAIYNSNN